VLVTETEHAHIFEVSHGERPRTREIVDAASLALALVTDIAARRAYAVLDKRTRGLSVAAYAPVVKELLRRAFGEVLAGDCEFFRADAVIDLSPFSHPRAALSREGVPGLVRVEMHAITVLRPSGAVVSLSRAHRDVLGDAADAALVEEALSRGTPVGVKLYLLLEGRAEANKIELTASGRRNVLEIDRDDVELVEIAHAYFRARGVMREPSRLRAPAKAAIDAHASASQAE
jgi:hypothetical protein